MYHHVWNNRSGLDISSTNKAKKIHEISFAYFLDCGDMQLGEPLYFPIKTK